MRVVITANRVNTYSSRRLATAFETAGHSVNFVSPFDCALKITGRQVDVLAADPAAARPEAVLLRATATTDLGIRLGRPLETFLATHYQLQGAVCVNDPQAKLRAGNKFLSLQIMAGAGVPVPPTVLACEPVQAQLQAEEMFGFPCIIKANEGAWGEGVALASDAPSVGLAVQQAHTEKRFVLVQQYLHGPAICDLRVLVIGDEAVAAISRVPATGDYRANFHRGGQAKPFALTAVVAATAIKAAQALGLQLAGVDILLTEAGPVVLEANPSPGLEQIETVTGLDIAAKLVAHLEQCRRNPRAGCDRLNRRS